MQAEVEKQEHIKNLYIAKLQHIQVEALTATGTVPTYNPSGISTISVDPSVIPLGSLVYVDGYGKAIAADTGGAIKGNIIDVYVNS